MLAVLVLYAFLRRFKPTLIIAIAIPVSILATFGPLYLNNVSLNVMSLGGLAIGVGMLVDDSIVVLEAIQRRRELGEGAVLGGRQRHARDGARGDGDHAHDRDRVPPDRVRRRRRGPDLPRPGARGRLQPHGVDGRGDGRSCRCSRPSSAKTARRSAAAAGRRGSARSRSAVGPRSRPWAFRTVARGELAARGSESLLWTVPLVLIQLPFEIVGEASSTPLVLVVVRDRRRPRRPDRQGPRRRRLAVPLALRPRVPRVPGRARGVAQGARCRTRLLTVAVAGDPHLARLARDRARSSRTSFPPMRQGLFTVETQLDVGTLRRADRRAHASSSRRGVRRADRGAPASQVASVSSQVGVARDAIAKPGEGSHTSKLFIQLRAVEEAARDRERRRARRSARSSRSSPASACP